MVEMQTVGFSTPMCDSDRRCHRYDLITQENKREKNCFAKHGLRQVYNMHTWREIKAKIKVLIYTTVSLTSQVKINL